MDDFETETIKLSYALTINSINIQSSIHAFYEKNIIFRKNCFYQ